MQSFEQKVIAPLLQSAQQTIDAAARIPDVTARAERLVEGSDDVSASFSRVAERQLFKAAGFVMLGTLAGVATMLSVTGIAASSLVAVMVGGAVSAPSLPAAFGSLGVFLGSMAGAGIMTEKYKAVKSAWNAVNAKFDRAVRTLAAAHPTETATSLKLKAFLKRTFNPAASLETKQAPSAQPAAKPVVARPAL